MMEIKAQQFVTSTGRQVLTDNGQRVGSLAAAACHGLELPL
ncbi:hypothetical protein [Escherichia coli]|nr:hypothetical protein [Escherichia coli]